MWNVQGTKKKTISPERLPGGCVSDQEMLGDAETEGEKKAGLEWGVGHGCVGTVFRGAVSGSRRLEYGVGWEVGGV